MKTKKLVSLLLVFAMLCGFSVCFVSAADRAIGVAYISLEDNGVRTESDVNFPTPLGTIFAQSSVDIYDGDTVASVTARFLASKGATANITDTRWGTKYLASIQNFTVNGQTIASFGEFDGGDWSGWMYRFNNQVRSDAIDTVSVENGDVIRWMYSCQAGPDIGQDFSETSAAITGVKTSTGTLSPAFTAGTKEYTLSLAANVTSIKVEAELKDYATNVTYTLSSGGREVNYKYNRDIPVEDGDKIIISTSKTTMLYAEDYTYLDTVEDTDRVVITIAQKQGGVLDYIRAFFRAIVAFIKNLFTRLGG